MNARLPLTRHLVSAAGFSLALGLGVFAANDARADEAFTISVDAPAAKVGAPTSVKVRIKPGAGRHINKDYPTSVKITAPGGVDLPKASISAKDAGKVEEAEAWIDVAYTAKVAGKKSFTGTVSFAVCTATSCDPRKAPVNFDVDVK